MPHSKLSVYLATLSIATALIATTTNAMAQPTTSPTPPAAPLTTPSVEQILIGEWQLDDILPIGIKAIFTADKKLQIFVPSSFPFFDGFTKAPIVLDFRYRIDNTTTPYQLDILSPSGGEPLLTIFELPTAKEMRVEFVGLKVGDPRPTSFTVGALVLEKLSTTTALPRNVQLIDVQAEKTKQSQSQARFSMLNINNSQIFYYNKNKRFATSISQLGTYLSPNDNYNYKISPHPSQKPGAIATAEPKSANLKSYTAAVVAIKVKGKNTVFTGICETNANSKTAPTAPKIDNKGTVTCSPDSTAVK